MSFRANQEGYSYEKGVSKLRQEIELFGMFI